MSRIAPPAPSRFFTRLALVALLVFQTSSCVPLFVGGVIGYVARDQGVGKVGPVDGGGDKSYDYNSSSGYDDGAAYEYEEPGFSDMPVY